MSDQRLLAVRGSERNKYFFSSSTTNLTLNIQSLAKNTRIGRILVQKSLSKAFHGSFKVNFSVVVPVFVDARSVVQTGQVGIFCFKIHLRCCVTPIANEKLFVSAQQLRTTVTTVTRPPPSRRAKIAHYAL